jgi:hypothetical protein
MVAILLAEVVDIPVQVHILVVVDIPVQVHILVVVDIQDTD